MSAATFSDEVRTVLDGRNFAHVATALPSGAPHSVPVWILREGDRVCFFTQPGSRKARNLAADPRCVVTTENAVEPVVIEGAAEVVTDPQALTRMLALENAKYQTAYSMELLDPAVNATIRVQPRWAFGLAEGDFTGSPTRWTFQPERA
jgi:PPOX class probable F420-dependent enzyme